MSENKDIKTALPKLRFPEFVGNNEWRETPIKGLCKIGNGKDYKHLDNGDIPVYGSGGYMLSVNDYLYDGESVCIGRKGTINKPMLLSGKFWTVDTLFYTHSFNKCSPIFLYCLFQNIDWLSLNEAGGVPSLSKMNIEVKKVFTPEVDEQTKIAECLSSLDDAISGVSEKIEALKEYKKGLMQQLLPTDGKTTPAFRFPEFKDSKPWGEITLSKLAKFRRGSFPQPYGLPEWYDDEGLPFIQVFDVDNNLLIKPKTKSRISKLAAKQSVFIPKETIIVTIQGSIGRVAITQYDAYIDRTLLLFEEFYKPINKRFVAYVLQLLFEIEKQKAPGGIIKTITKEVLSNFNILLPNLDEQTKIAECIGSIDNLIDSEVNRFEQLKDHKKGLMQQLFPNLNEQ